MMLWKSVLLTLMIASVAFLPVGSMQMRAAEAPNQITEDAAASTQAVTSFASSGVVSSGIISSIVSSVSSIISIIDSVRSITFIIIDGFSILESFMQQLEGNAEVLAQVGPLLNIQENFDIAIAEINVAEDAIGRAFEALNNAATLGIAAAVDAANEELNFARKALESADEVIEEADDIIEIIDRLVEALIDENGGDTLLQDLDQELESVDDVVESVDDIIESAIMLVEAIEEMLQAAV